MSPIADGRNVIFHVGGHDSGALTAFDATSGAVTWRWDGDGPAYASPVIVDLGGVRQVVTMTQRSVVGVDAGTGALLWRRPFENQFSNHSISPIVYGDTVIISGYEMGVIALAPTRRGGAWIVEPRWETADVSMFMSNPVLIGDTLYGLSQRASGQFYALDARTGKVLWSHDSSADTGVPVPGWGFSSSPLVIDDKVIVAASGALIAYDAATGERRWLMKSRGGSYSSPHLLTIDGVDQVVLMGGEGTTGVAVADGTVLWANAWAGAPMVQPALLAGGDLVITSADAMGGLGVRRLGLANGPGGWTVTERWTSRGLKPYFNDYVIHKGHAYGFDGNILSSVNLETGERAWKGGRYGNGQMLLLADQDLLLVTSEEGELALVSATPAKYTEIARVPALNAKTWNHPVIVGDVLLVRNGEEMAAFRLSLDSAATR
jgi:outer membrane protein assembly factor BamB